VSLIYYKTLDVTLALTPALSPRRGRTVQRSLEFSRALKSSADLVTSIGRGSIHRTVVENSKRRRPEAIHILRTRPKVLPLLGGEGRGEGERSFFTEGGQSNP